MHEMKRLVKSFRAAFSGITATFKKEKNMQIHGWIGIIVTILSIWAAIPWMQYLIILFLILLIWSLELINTAIELAFDVHSKERNPLIKKGKDAAAGAVLLLSIFAVLLGITLLFKPLLIQIQKFHDYLTIMSITSPYQIAVMICLWLLLLGVMIRWNRTFNQSILITLVVYSSLFVLFFMSTIPWFQLVIFVLPFIFIIFTQRGMSTLYGFLQTLISGFGVYLLFHLLK